MIDESEKSFYDRRTVKFVGKTAETTFARLVLGGESVWAAYRARAVMA